MRAIHTDLDVAQEKRIDDYWHVDESRSLSNSLTNFTRFTPKGYMWSGERLTKLQTTTRTDHVWREVWIKIGKSAEKQKTRMGEPEAKT